MDTRQNDFTQFASLLTPRIGVNYNLLPKFLAYIKISLPNMR